MRVFKNIDKEKILDIIFSKNLGLYHEIKFYLENKRNSDTQKICELINNEFLMEGIFPDYEANEYGKKLEQLIDYIINDEY